MAITLPILLRAAMPIATGVMRGRYLRQQEDERKRREEEERARQRRLDEQREIIFHLDKQLKERQLTDQDPIGQIRGEYGTRSFTESDLQDPDFVRRTYELMGGAEETAQQRDSGLTEYQRWQIANDIRQQRAQSQTAEIKAWYRQMVRLPGNLDPRDYVREGTVTLRSRFPELSEAEAFAIASQAAQEVATERAMPVGSSPSSMDVLMQLLGTSTAGSDASGRPRRYDPAVAGSVPAAPAPASPRPAPAPAPAATSGPMRAAGAGAARPTGRQLTPVSMAPDDVIREAFYLAKGDTVRMRELLRARGYDPDR